MTDEMHNRILDHIQKSDLQNQAFQNHVEPYCQKIWFHCGLPGHPGSKCGCSAKSMEATGKSGYLEGITDIVTVSSLPSLATVVGFEPSGIPSLPFEVQERSTPYIGRS